MKKLKLFAAVIVSILTLTAPVSVLATENTSTEQSASGYEVKDTSLTCYVNSEKGLNVRSGPSTDYSVIGTLSNGSKIEVTGESGGWYRFDYNGKDGFVATKYTATQASDSNGSNFPASRDHTTIRLGKDLNIKRAPTPPQPMTIRLLPQLQLMGIVNQSLLSLMIPLWSILHWRLSLSLC